MGRGVGLNVRTFESQYAVIGNARAFVCLLYCTMLPVIVNTP
jgi:hypothetical protein